MKEIENLLESMNLQDLLDYDPSSLQKTDKEIVQCLQKHESFECINILNDLTNSHVIRYMELCNNSARREVSKN